MTTSARERFEKLKFKLVIPDESFAKYDELEDFMFLISLVEAAETQYVERLNSFENAKFNLRQEFWQEIEQRIKK